ncbi:hypothetical protein O9G_005905 [Rozella allomycis CSF55]|uniref:Uncharacterized protein n=1 Tax=Rozella allomycis (strain CSF55) TaxID=988480 RepID=A0A075B4E0_ROZAC|nr:hypothetical protein O9G_005905 [Rozella allomycis CSF55]|eukprot:EPZ36265.1 hypothetical protein O9G_005905 [Rozella allomycis CSF55]
MEVDANGPANTTERQQPDFSFVDSRLVVFTPKEKGPTEETLNKWLEELYLPPTKVTSFTHPVRGPGTIYHFRVENREAVDQLTRKHEALVYLQDDEITAWQIKVLTFSSNVQELMKGGKNNDKLKTLLSLELKIPQKEIIRFSPIESPETGKYILHVATKATYEMIMTKRIRMLGDGDAELIGLIRRPPAPVVQNIVQIVHSDTPAFPKNQWADDTLKFLLQHRGVTRVRSANYERQEMRLYFDTEENMLSFINDSKLNLKGYEYKWQPKDATKEENEYLQVVYSERSRPRSDSISAQAPPKKSKEPIPARERSLSRTPKAQSSDEENFDTPTCAHCR